MYLNASVFLNSITYIYARDDGWYVLTNELIEQLEEISLDPIKFDDSTLEMETAKGRNGPATGKFKNVLIYDLVLTIQSNIEESTV